MQLLDLAAVTPDSTPSVDDIIVCGACRAPSVVTLLATRLLTEDELARVPHEVRNDLRFAIRELDVKLKQN